MPGPPLGRRPASRPLSRDGNPVKTCPNDLGLAANQVWEEDDSGNEALFEYVTASWQKGDAAARVE